MYQQDSSDPQSLQRTNLRLSDMERVEKPLKYEPTANVKREVEGIHSREVTQRLDDPSTFTRKTAGGAFDLARSFPGSPYGGAGNKAWYQRNTDKLDQGPEDKSGFVVSPVLPPMTHKEFTGARERGVAVAGSADKAYGKPGRLGVLTPDLKKALQSMKDRVLDENVLEEGELDEQTSVKIVPFPNSKLGYKVDSDSLRQAVFDGTLTRPPLMDNYKTIIKDKTHPDHELAKQQLVARRKYVNIRKSDHIMKNIWGRGEEEGTKRHRAYAKKMRAREDKRMKNPLDRASLPNLPSNWRELGINHPERKAYREKLKAFRAGRESADDIAVAKMQADIDARRRAPSIERHKKFLATATPEQLAKDNEARLALGSRYLPRDVQSKIKAAALDNDVKRDASFYAFDSQLKGKDVEGRPRATGAEYDGTYIDHMVAQDLSDIMKKYVDAGEKVPKDIMSVYKKRNPAERAYIANRFDPPKDGPKKPSSMAKAKPPASADGKLNLKLKDPVFSTDFISEPDNRFDPIFTKKMRFRNLPTKAASSQQNLLEERSYIKKIIEEVYDEVLAEEGWFEPHI
jgi:hypothetical protein